MSLRDNEEGGGSQETTTAPAPAATAPAPSATAVAAANFKSGFADGILTIRELEAKDVRAVNELCFKHFRSTGLSAARYYIVAQIQELSLLGFLGFVFMSWSRFVLSVVIFLVYLFAKSRWELEQYIRHDCDDLKTAYSTYMENGPQSRFWVAEMKVDDGRSIIAGCVGLVPSKETANVGKLVRLIVDSAHRRMKIGSRLLMQVEQYASDIGFTDMRIYTNSLNPTHVKFVRQHGYTIAQTVRRGLMRGDLMTWHKTLIKPSLRKRDASEFDLTIRSAASHVMD